MVLGVDMTAKLMASAAVVMTERTFLCRDGMKLAAQCYTMSPCFPSSSSSSSHDTTTTTLATTKTHNILMLHGWLDNCRSFHQLAPQVLQQYHLSATAAANATTQDKSDNAMQLQLQVIALDLPGHGWSDHKSKDNASGMLLEATYYVADVLHQLDAVNTMTDRKTTETAMKPQETEFTSTLSSTTTTLLGHSMGAAISLAYAAAFPEQIDSLILLEGVGPLSRPASTVAQRLRTHVEQRFHGNDKLYPTTTTTTKNKGPRIYPSLEQAALVRQKSASMVPGNHHQYISIEAARELVCRAVVPVMSTATTTNTNPDTPTPTITDTSNTTKDMSKININSDKNDNGDDNTKTTTTTPSSIAATPVMFRHDPRLHWSSILYMTSSQVEALQLAIQCPVSLLLAQDGWKISTSAVGDGIENELERIKKRLNTNPKQQSSFESQNDHHHNADDADADDNELLQQFAILPGSHHFHADPTTSLAVVQHVVQFLIHSHNRHNK